MVAFQAKGLASKMVVLGHWFCLGVGEGRSFPFLPEEQFHCLLLGAAVPEFRALHAPGRMQDFRPSFVCRAAVAGRPCVCLSQRSSCTEQPACGSLVLLWVTMCGESKGSCAVAGELAQGLVLTPEST